jgi:hypothetical protein
LRTLRFVVATTSDPALKKWAEAEAKQVQAELDGIDREIAVLLSPAQSSNPMSSDREDPSSPSPNGGTNAQSREANSTSKDSNSAGEDLAARQEAKERLQQLRKQKAVARDAKTTRGSAEKQREEAKRLQQLRDQRDMDRP